MLKWLNPIEDIDCWGNRLFEINGSPPFEGLDCIDLLRAKQNIRTHVYRYVYLHTCILIQLLVFRNRYIQIFLPLQSCVLTYSVLIGEQ